MKPIESKIQINAAPNTVFDTVSDINNFSKAIDHIVHSEIISDVKSGVGTRFRETRLMRGKETTEELEVVEFVQNEKIRIICDSHGTVWDSVFEVKADGNKTELALTMDAKPYKFLPKLMNPLIKGFVQSALNSDMEAVKNYCESLK